MDRVQPIEIQGAPIHRVIALPRRFTLNLHEYPCFRFPIASGPREAFTTDPVDSSPKSTPIANTKVKKIFADAAVIELESLEPDPDPEARMVKEAVQPPPPSLPPPELQIPRIIVTRESDLSPTESHSLPGFEELVNPSRFRMAYSGMSLSYQL
jgi:hypothetical protein